MKGSYFHDNNEGHFSCQNVPELHGLLVLPLMSRRITVVTVSVKTTEVVQEILNMNVSDH